MKRKVRAEPVCYSFWIFVSMALMAPNGERKRDDDGHNRNGMMQNMVLFPFVCPVITNKCNVDEERKIGLEDYRRAAAAAAAMCFFVWSMYHVQCIMPSHERTWCRDLRKMPRHRIQQQKENQQLFCRTKVIGQRKVNMYIYVYSTQAHPTASNIYIVYVRFAPATRRKHFWMFKHSTFQHQNEQWTYTVMFCAFCWPYSAPWKTHVRCSCVWNWHFHYFTRLDGKRWCLRLKIWSIAEVAAVRRQWKMKNKKHSNLFRVKCFCFVLIITSQRCARVLHTPQLFYYMATTTEESHMCNSQSPVHRKTMHTVLCGFLFLFFGFVLINFEIKSEKWRPMLSANCLHYYYMAWAYAADSPAFVHIHLIKFKY